MQRSRVVQGIVLFTFALFAVTGVLAVSQPQSASAAVSSTLNFQSRLETAGGAIVPDGNYNVEFKLYSTSTVTGTPDQGACTYNGGTTDPNCLWLETRTGANQVRVVNGYLTVNLGSITSFPTTINWNQQLYLTMRIGGTGTPSWDTEMSPRIQLTAVPYAFQAGALGNGTNQAVLDASGNLVFQQASTVKELSAATGMVLTIQSGAATSGTNVGGNLLLQGGAGASTGASGSVIVKSNTNNSTTAFQVQDASSASVLTADTVDHTVTLHSGNDQRSLTGELYSGNFSSGWTTTGWNVSSGTTAFHNTGNTSSLINTNVAISAGTTYAVTFQLSTFQAGPNTCDIPGTENLTVYVGGTQIGQDVGGDCSAPFTTTFVGTATSTAGLTFTPTSNWPGHISAISIKALSGVIHPALAVQNLSGMPNMEVRANADGSSTYIGLTSGSNEISGGYENTALGINTLQSNLGGSDNTAMGAYALQHTSSGYNNTGVGDYALFNNTNGTYNSAFGDHALATNTTGESNTALGTNTLESNTSGTFNTGVGNAALDNNMDGSNNTAIGDSALGSNTSGFANVAVGDSSLCANTTGSNNLGLGYNAGCIDSGSNFSTLATLQNATAIGAYAQVQASNSIVLGSVDTATNVGIGITVPSNVFSVSPLDYQTGTATRTNSSATLVGASTTWTSAMVGDLIVFADGTTNTVAAFTDATHITLGTTYTGTTDASPVHYRFHKPGFQVTSAGNAFVQNTSTTAFQIQNAAGTSNLFVVDTVDTKIGIGTATPTATLTVSAPSGYAGNIIDLQVNGSSKLSVDQSGNVTAASLSLTNSSANKFVETFQHMSSELASDQTTNSTTLSDVWSITFSTSRAATVNLTGAGEFDCTAGCASPHYLRLQLVLDGVVEQETPLPLTSSSFALPFSFNWSTGYQAVSAGSHTARLRWAVDSTGPTAAFFRTLNGSPRSSFGATAYYY